MHPFDSNDEINYLSVGCFSRVAGHNISSSEDDAKDWKCMGHTAGLVCNSGVPFYQMRSNAMSPSMCYEFCTGKGMDIFALVDGIECKCGATAVNHNIWHRQEAKPTLMFNLGKLSPFTDDMKLCPLRAYRYTGHFEAGGLPYALQQISQDDQVYIDSIVAGYLIPHGHEDAPEKVEMELMQKLGKQNPEGFNRNCYPDNCGPGRGPWEGRTTTAPSGVTDRWQDYTVIPFIWTAGIDDTRKEAFRLAVKKWHHHTCIVLVEESSTPSVPYIEVGWNYQGSNGCWLSGMGWPGYSFDGSPGYSLINLGWCNSMTAVGNMVHEIGHAIGMNHEQKRPDGPEEYQGHGPHLIMHWENLDAKWTPQYLPDASSYVGSTDQGTGDPFSGYAPYDFESIMHYPAGDAYDTDPPENENLMGNRQYLTSGDIAQMLDAYQCKVKPSWTPPLDCDFEVGNCFWTDQGSGAWTGGMRGSTASSNTGPQQAYQGSGYSFTEASWNEGKDFILESPALDPAASYSMTFHYHMYGANMGSFSVDAELTGGTWQSIFSRSGDQGDQWAEASVQLPAGSQAARFKVVIGSGYRSDVAIDDLKVTKTSVASPTPPTTTTTTTTTTATTTTTSTTTTTTTTPIVTTSNAATPSPHQSGLPDVGCDFEGGFCNWINSGSPNHEWSLQSGSTQSSGTGPSGAHGGSYYAYTEASYGGNDQDFFLEQSFAPVQASFSLSFYYHMYGSNMGSLTLEAQSGTATWQQLWTLAGDQGDQWKAVSLLVPSGTTALRFYGRTGNSYRSDICIDDLTVTP